ncbi:MAG TPA: HAMP domain-containing sensor histidine kinase [Nocardioides sp.]|nr:HAMP domain-containing sensor histidine kinase [Nocardioides sp.]
MRRRLLVLAVTLVGLVLVALAVPLMTTYAEDRTQDFYVNRLGHVTRLAVVAEDVLELGDARALDVDLDRYVEVYGGSVAVLDANRQVVAQGGEGVGSVAVTAAVEEALAGRPTPPPATVWPWSADPAVIGSPVGRDAQVLGAVVLVAPTDRVGDAVATWLGWLSAGALAVLLLTVFGVVAPFVGWVMRPVHDLGAAARRLAGGDLSSRAHAIGPPELRELAGTFNTMADNVETSQRQQRDLVADAAHQLGNPLTALRLRVENLAASGADPEEARRAVEEADRLNALVGSLLDLSRVGSGALEVGVGDVAGQARHRCAMWEPVFPRLDLEVHGPAVARLTDGLVDLVLDTALDNAAKFAPGTPVTVSVDGASAPGEVRLTVRDRGPGLPAEEVAKVGDRFFRGRTHQNVTGTGLGLAIVRARVQVVGGRLEVGAADGGGLRVGVVLPAAPASALRPGTPGTTGALPGGDPPAR